MKQRGLPMNRYETIREFYSLAPKNVSYLIEGNILFYLHLLEQKDLRRKLTYLVSNKLGVFYLNVRLVGGLRPRPSTL